ncbi:chromodomain-helicase-DNA-binding protein 9 isoform X2 [Patella vulgata]|uniref:chromodomain-helicase-DNA-binding protein 9 isoform X2 n=1 Tax=Patella vulgata TaxID=6465 RepID=UPI00217FD1C3|nr:chromodomain-helicase-DNA-binding protein 9 isoform X2 [Patella vulgata]
MADEPMLSLFDADGGFLSDLTSPGDGGLGQPELGGVLPGSENGIMSQGMGAMQRQMPTQSDNMMMPQQSQNTSVQGYPQLHSLPQENYRGMPPQSSMMNRQQYRGQQDAFSQYGQVPKLHHITDSSSMMMSNQNQNMMTQNMRPQQQQQQQQQQTFGSPPQSGMMSGQQAGYHGYMSPRPRMASQQMGMVHNQQWGASQQTSPNQQQQQQQYMTQQPRQQMMVASGNNHMPSFPSQQRDYNMPSNPQQMGHYPTATPHGQSHFIQGMRSPPSGTRMPMASSMSPNNMNMMAQMQQQQQQQHPMKPAQSFPQQPSQAASSQANANLMPSYNQQQVIQQQHGVSQRFPGEYLTDGPQLTSGTNPQPNHHYSTYSGSQHVPVSVVAPGMGDANALSLYTTNRSPNNTNLPFQSPYSSMGQSIGQPCPQAPSPHSSSGSTTPSLLPGVSQGNYGQSSLQQLEQLVSPSIGSISAANPFQTVMQSTPASNLNIAPKQPIYSSSNFQTNIVSSTGPVNGGPRQVVSPAGQMVMAGKNGPISPSPSQQMMPGLPNQQGVNLEVQRLQQQIQQLYNMPQTQQIQQQMLDLQERMRMLKAQQQQQILHMQQQQCQPRPNIAPGQSSHHIPPQVLSRTPQHQVRMPHPQPTNQPAPQQQVPLPIQPRPPQTQQHPSQPVQPIVISAMPQLSPKETGTPSSSTPPTIIPSLGDSLDTPSFAPSIQVLPTSTSQPSIHSTHQGLNTPETCPPLSPPTLDPYKFTPLDADPTPIQKLEMPGLTKSNQSQEKANRIIADAIAKAQASGLTDIPKVVDPDSLLSTVTDGTEGESSPEKKPRKKRVKKDGEKKEKKERKPKKPKDPADPETPKEPKKRKKKVKATTVVTDAPPADVAVEGDVVVETTDSAADTSTTMIDVEKPVEEAVVEKTETPEKKPPTSKLFTKRKKPPATFMQKNKKRKRTTSPDLSDLDVSPQGSPKDDDSVLKRRSSRNTKRKKYMDELDLNLSDDNTEVDIEGLDNGPVAMKADESTGEEVIVVEKILGVRIRKRDKDESAENGDDTQPAITEEEEEFLVKFKNYSHLHCDWRTQKELEEKDKRILGKIKRFRQKKQQQNVFELNEDDEEYFNPDYTEVDRVLDEQIAKDPATQQEMTYFLVKWRSMAYEDCTWELQQDVDPTKVESYRKFKVPPPEDERKEKERPKPSEWTQLDKSREYKNDNRIRDYQLEGVNWLTFCYFNRQNCILADEMGLGKTIQSITFLHEIDLYGIHGPFLVVAPLSTIANWQREFETWTDMNVITYHGTGPSRTMLQEYEIYYRDSSGAKIPDLYKIHALITTYEVIISDIELLSSIKWRCLIIDEAHRLKNRNCRLMDGLNKIQLEHRVLLTGTPLQNNTDELFSLLNFLEPKQFASSEAFVAEFGTLKTESQVDQLKEILKPMMLRRLKEDVEKNLAPKEETIVEVELTNIQKKYYRAILERNFTFLSKGSTGSANVPNLMNTMMELRKCCNHPFLIKGAEDKILDDMKTKTPTDHDPLFNSMVQSCGKMVLMDKLLPKLKQGGHKVLIFSQMIKVLDILEDYLLHKQYLYERLDGRIRGNIRQEAIDRFSKPDSDRFVFLLCTRAGGLGINLTAADTCIIYDSDWNPQNDLQAQARCHRIGQSKAVKIYRLVTRNSYEREMFDRASMKLGLDKAVLQSLGGENKGVNQASQLSKKEVEELLKKGAYGALMDDDTTGDDFCEEDIDQILQRRTQVIQIESEGKGSTFAKASFSLSTNRSDIDINDPEFWQKWAKKADLDVDEISSRNDLIIEQPRRRKQTARFGNDDNVVDMSELESSSDSDDENKSSKRKSKRGRKKDDDEDFNEDYTGDGYCRSECFKVEKMLLIYGWGRWGDILHHVRFKRKLDEKDVETIARGILVCCLSYYKGDEKIKSFIWDLVSPHSDAVLKNHKGLSAPVPRGRKGKSKKDSNIPDIEPDLPVIDKNSLDFNPASILDPAYTRHLDRHSNKVLLRVRLLYYLKQEIVGEEAKKVFQGANIKDINIPKPSADRDTPTFWWDELADRSLIVGIFKHGYEKYHKIRSDPTLVFLSRCGPPDGAALLAEQNEDNDDKNDDDDDDDDEASMASAPDTKKKPAPPSEDFGDKLPFPGTSELNSRLRRLITCYQRTNKKRIMEMEMQARKMEKRGKSDMAVREREYRRRESLQNRWSRREEADFYKTVSTYGVEIDKKTGRFIWDRFRNLARLEKKFDDTLTEYFQGFYFMCQRVCGKLSKDIKPPPNTMYVEPITEERATRCLSRIDLINKVREEILFHPKLDEHIQLCQPSFDMPSWWQCGKHDKELLIGAARHGVARTDYHILRDPTLSFHEIFQKANRGINSPFSSINPNGGTPRTPSTPRGGTPVLLKEELDRESTATKKDSVKKENEKDMKPENEDNKSKSPIKIETDDEQVQNDKEEDASEVTEKSEKNDSSEKTEVKCETKQEVTVNGETSDTESDKKKMKVEESESRTKDEEVMNSDKVKEEDITEKDKIKEEKDDVKVEEEEDVKLDSDKVKVEESELKVEKDKVKEESKEIKDEPMESSEEKDNKEEFVKIKDKLYEKKMEVLDEDELIKRELRSVTTPRHGNLQFPGMYNEDYLDPDGPEPGEIVGGRSFLSTQLDWPKDRVIFHRLEHVCYTVEKGEWPFSKKGFVPSAAFDSRSTTPVGCSTPKGGDTPHGDSDVGENTFEGIQGEGLRMTIQKRSRGRKRKYDIDPDRATRVQQILNQSQTPHSAASSDNESLHEPMNLSAIHAMSGEHFLNGHASELDAAKLRNSLIEQGLLPERRKRGRKKKAEKMAELAMAEALAKRHHARIVANLDPDLRIPVISLEDGSRLSGEEAPKKKNLEQWLMDHPGYVVEQPDLAILGAGMGGDEEEQQRAEHELNMEKLLMRSSGKRRARLDPRLMDLAHVTGEENVTVVERETGKKMTGAKAPPLKHLSEWLEQNPGYDVDSKWGEIVRAKANLPKSMDSRLLKPSNRGRKPKDPMLNPALLSGEYPFAGMAGLAGYPGLMGNFHKLGMNMPFGAMSNMGLANPMFASLAGMGFPGMNMGAFGSGELEHGEIEKEDKKDRPKEDKRRREDGGERSKDREKDRKSSEKPSSSSTSSPHPSFPLYFNPLLYNPLLAQGMGNFPLPAGLPTSFASLANPYMANGRTESESDDDKKNERRHREEKLKLKARELKEKMSHNDEVQDLSVKKKTPRKPDSHSVRKVSQSEHERRCEKLEQMEATDLSMKARSNSSGRHNSTNSSSRDSSHKSSENRVREREREKDRSRDRESDHSLNSSSVTSSKTPQSSRSSPAISDKASIVTGTPGSSSRSGKSNKKIFSSLKLSKIVDSLKEKVQNIEDKEKKKCDNPKEESQNTTPTKPESSPSDSLDLSSAKGAETEKSESADES